MPQRFDELKVLPEGEIRRFPSTLLCRGERWAIIVHRTERDYNLPGLFIPRGTKSYGVFVEGEPWTVYLWVEEGEEVMGFYVNAADSVVVGEDHVVWRDLYLDVLILPTGRRTLDYEEAVRAYGRKRADVMKGELEKNANRAVERATTLLEMCGVILKMWE
ncbi:MAG: DUF402 domain-containing protein [Thermoplasmata archaeon]|nr:DUF402 domain-containing protein [Thermoplasmata archaeon]